MSEHQPENPNPSFEEDTVRRQIWDLIYEERFSEAFAASEAWSSKGSLDARFFLGWLHEQGKGTSCDLLKAYDAYQSVAALGEPRAQFYAGRLCLRTNRPSEAIEWLERASARDYPPASFRLFAIYSQGKIVAMDVRKSDFYLEKAARLGHLHASKQMAIRMIKGTRIQRAVLRGCAMYLWALANGARRIIRDPYTTHSFYMDG